MTARDRTEPSDSLARYYTLAPLAACIAELAIKHVGTGKRWIDPSAGSGALLTALAIADRTIGAPSWHSAIR